MGTGHVNLVSVQVINTTMFVRRSHLFIQNDLRFASFARINYCAVTRFPTNNIRQLRPILHDECIDIMHTLISTCMRCTVK